MTSDFAAQTDREEADRLIQSDFVPAACDTEPTEVMALLEALLLVTPEPAEIRDLAEAAMVSVSAIEQAIAAMARDATRGWVVVRHGSTLHLASAPRFASAVRRFLRMDRQTKLSGASLETLALIAYRQPVTRAELEGLRGVDCSGVLATLHARGLIEIGGKLATVGNPNQYVTSIEFLRQFGLTSLHELPPLEEFRGHPVDETGPAVNGAEAVNAAAEPSEVSPS